MFSVRVRILTAILLVTALGMLVAGGAAFLVQRQSALDDVDDRLSSAAAAIDPLLTGGHPDASDGPTAPAPTEQPTLASAEEAVQFVVSRLAPDRNQATVGIVAGEARWVPSTPMDFHLEDDARFIDRVITEIETVGAGSESVLGTASTELGPLRYVAVPIRYEGDTELGIFVTAFNLDDELAESYTSVRTFLITAGVALLVIALVGWFVAGRLLKPVRTLRDTASRITATDLSQRIPVRGNDDLSALTVTINDMLERLDNAIAAQSRLLADVRHELLTPITIVRGHLELLDVTDARDVAATQALALEELDRMAALVRDIEALAAAQGGSPLAKQPTDVFELTEQVFTKASALSDNDWVLGERATAVAELDAARITQAWLQLADNARKYSPDGSRIEVGSTLTDGTVELWVLDEGPGVPQEARERIFERLARADTGRGVSGSGLGLAIVTAIAHAHGGRVDLESSASGSRFAIVLPLANAVPEEVQ